MARKTKKPGTREGQQRPETVDAKQAGPINAPNAPLDMPVPDDIMDSNPYLTPEPYSSPAIPLSVDTPGIPNVPIPPIEKTEVAKSQGGENHVGIQCPHCGCKHNRVTHTTQTSAIFNGKRYLIIRRRRECGYQNCKLPFYTIEKYQPDS